MMRDHLRQDEIFGFDALLGDRRAAALEHLCECASCRAECLAHSETSVFSLLSRAPLPEERLEQLSARIGTALDELKTPLPRRVFRVASIAASLLLAAALGAVMWNHEVPARGVTFAELDPAGAEEDVAGIRLVATPGGEAQVMDLSIGETQILMIFDESIEL